MNNDLSLSYSFALSILFVHLRPFIYLSVCFHRLYIYVITVHSIPKCLPKIMSFVSILLFLCLYLYLSLALYLFIRIFSLSNSISTYYSIHICLLKIMTSVLSSPLSLSFALSVSFFKLFTSIFSSSVSVSTYCSIHKCLPEKRKISCFLRDLSSFSSSRSLSIPVSLFIHRHHFIVQFIFTFTSIHKYLPKIKGHLSSVSSSLSPSNFLSISFTLFIYQRHFIVQFIFTYHNFFSKIKRPRLLSPLPFHHLIICLFPSLYLFISVI